MPEKFICRDYTESLRVDKLDAHAERFFARLMMKADDYGRRLNNDQLLNSALFPLKRNIRDTDIARWKADCLRAGLLHCYVDSAGRSIVEIINFGQKKKFMRSKFDPPDGQQNFSLPPNEVDIEVEGKRRKSSPTVETKTGTNGSVREQANGHQRAREPWQMLKDEHALTERIKQEAQSVKPDPALLAGLKKQRDQVRAEIKTI